MEGWEFNESSSWAFKQGEREKKVTEFEAGRERTEQLSDQKSVIVSHLKRT